MDFIKQTTAMNFTIVVPPGTTNHGNSKLICLPPKWNDYLIFYFTNYFAHAATIVTFPGQGLTETFESVLFALLFPGSGLNRAFQNIYRRARFSRSHPLEQAARAGAFCMVVKEREKITATLDGEQASFWAFLRDGVSQGDYQQPPQEQEELQRLADANSRHPSNQKTITWWDSAASGLPVPFDAKVHGEYRLPPGYRLNIVPCNAPVRYSTSVRDSTLANPNCLFGKPALGSTYSLPKLLISLLQTIWASITLYRARGDQINKYGYAAFGLTVAPYAWMSVVNTVANLLTPDYPALFLVRTPIMEQAEADGGLFVGELLVEIDFEKKTPNEWDDGIAFYGLFAFLYVALSWIPLAIVGALSKFKAGSSTSLQRGFTMSWLVLGTLLGDLSNRDGRGVGLREASSTIQQGFRIVCLGAVLGVASVGGLVVVGIMIKNYGVCTIID